ncbi:sugar ABC transporter permease [Devosia geojensis]|uniref:Sugar ABC transporter permease n=1 Tax=Devosia geojensis TaxID=443610 RepID=A0A0F5FTT8_9HYPH|nr:carbohydrate ABC transporter permease [Devosia geojensis]KKB12284.1 sugar ABC transporter permease [Devosia geojensis]
MTDRAMTGSGSMMRLLLKHAVLLGCTYVMLYPLIWMISRSFMPEGQIFASPSLIPAEPTLENFVLGWRSTQGQSFSVFFLNSFIIAGLAVVGNLVACTITAYAFARMEFRGMTLMFAVLIVSLILPLQVLILPQYLVFNQIGWVDTFLPLTVPKFFAVDGFFVYLMTIFIRGLPKELDQAAIVDGCGRWQVLWYVIVPLCKPALATVAIFTFIWTWGDFFGQLVYLNSAEKLTVAVGLNRFLDTTGSSFYGQLLAMSTLSVVPVLIIFMLFQRLIVEGLATTGMKL